MFAPFEHQRRAAPFTLLFRGLFHPLNVFHVLLGVAEVFFELLVELAQRVGPLFLAVSDLIQLFFQASGVLGIEDFRKVLHQQIGHNQADLSGEKLSTRLLHVLPFLNRAENRRIR